MSSIPLTHHKQLVARKFADCDRGVGGDEHLQRRIRFLCTQSVDQANNPVWFKTYSSSSTSAMGELAEALRCRPAMRSRAEPRPSSLSGTPFSS